MDVRIAYAIATVAAIQPIADPRSRCGSTAIQYAPALAATQTSTPATSASRKRPPPTFV